MSRQVRARSCAMDTTDTQQIEYGRFDDLERRFGIRRSTAYELINAGKIKSSCVKKKGARSGIRLIDFDSVREFLKANTH